MCKTGFSKNSNSSFIGCYQEIVTAIPNRITLSYGCYNQVINIHPSFIIPSKPHCDFFATNPNGWCLGVNLRVKCSTAGAIHAGNVAIANKIATTFCDFIIPHYYNGPYDQGVDFFKVPLLLMSKSDICDEFGLTKAECDNCLNVYDELSEVTEDDENIVRSPEELEIWIEKTLNDLRNLYDSVI